jgi:hypothetical protein|tara:strand:+ start:182 stop:319 length:138 start_codon:yes stop_codon:yes gene_type:complete
MIYIFRCFSGGHTGQVEVTKNEPYITSGERPICDTCYDIAEDGSS